MANATVETCITLTVLDAGAMLALTRFPSAIATMHRQFCTAHAPTHPSAVSFRFASHHLWRQVYHTPPRAELSNEAGDDMAAMTMRIKKRAWSVLARA